MYILVYPLACTDYTYNVYEKMLLIIQLGTLTRSIPGSATGYI